MNQQDSINYVDRISHSKEFADDIQLVANIFNLAILIVSSQDIANDQ